MTRIQQNWIISLFLLLFFILLFTRRLASNRKCLLASLYFAVARKLSGWFVCLSLIVSSEGKNSGSVVARCCMVVIGRRRSVIEALKRASAAARRREEDDEREMAMQRQRSRRRRRCAAKPPTRYNGFTCPAYVLYSLHRRKSVVAKSYAKSNYFASLELCRCCSCLLTCDTTHRKN